MMTHNYTYAELYRAADKLWPGEAENILDNPTDEQLALILAVLASAPVGGWSVAGRMLPNQATANTTSW